MKPRSNVDPTRMAIAALERIRTVLVKSGYEDRLGEPMAMKELAAQAAILGAELPPSYVATMRLASRIGEPTLFLLSPEMPAASERLVIEGGEEARRYAPFCRTADAIVCFDKGGGRRLGSPVRRAGDERPRVRGGDQSELPIIEWQGGTAVPVAGHFGEWLDSVADAREEAVETAAKMPARLKQLLYELGFRFEYPVVGRLETADVAAVDELIGHELGTIVRADVDRLFDSSGKASVSLNVDEFTLAISLRTGIYVFEAEDVFRWLRTFRDENFFSDAVTVPSHPDQVRDLRRAQREPPLILRGVLEVAAQPAKKVLFRAASGVSADDFYLLARTGSTSTRAPSVILHVVDGVVTTSHGVEEPLNDLHVAPDGVLWGLTTTHAVRIGGGRTQSFPLPRPARVRPWWYGIGSAGGRVLVWGNGALLAFDEADGFVPFAPDAGLDEPESVVALQAAGTRLWMLVCSDHVGAVARFDGAQWQPIDENQVLEASLVDLDVWRGTAYVLDRDGGVWTIDGHHPPRPLGLHTYHQAFLTEAGTPRPLHGIRVHDGGTLLASEGGVLSVGNGDPLFHAVRGDAHRREPMRLVRVGRDSAVLALGGPNAWIWRSGGFHVIDMQSW